MITIFITIIVAFIFSTLIGHILHWSLHKKWTGRLKRSHMSHHLIMYPPHNLSSDVYKSSGKDSSVIIFTLAALIIMCITTLVSLLLLHSISIMITNIIVITTNGLLHNYIHDSFHLNKSWLDKFEYYKEIKRLHYIHHTNMKKNFGIFSFFYDKLFGTFKK
jgi:sterol desaturase/sphingolipid hydroxylase (fatty acid hydroxylase superfamily)